ncbi:MAG: hypothetical protein FJ297_03415 [Planctomycetes bacterium]|nr:hypothetical protein [Planctomycetota bacterium]
MFLFKGRRQRFELEGYLRKVADLTNPNGGAVETTQRRDSRINRVFPVLIAPWEDEQPVLAQCTFGLTQDVSEHGVAVILSRKFPMVRVVVGMWPTNEMLTATSSKPGFLVGDVRQTHEIGAAFHHIGVLLKELLDESHPAHEKLAHQARCLLPPDQLHLLKQTQLAHAH